MHSFAAHISPSQRATVRHGVPPRNATISKEVTDKITNVAHLNALRYLATPRFETRHAATRRNNFYRK